MGPAELSEPTGIARVDDILRGVIGAYELAFPGRVRGYYLTGSYADRCAVSGVSDIDLYVVFRGEMSAEEAEKARALRRCCELLSSVELDIPPRGETRLGENALSIKLASRLVYGEDIRDTVPLPDAETYARQVTKAPVLHLARLYGGLPLPFPLGFPNPEDPFFGFVETRADENGAPRVSTKPLVHVLGWAATASLALAAPGMFVARKGEWPALYREYIRGEHAAYLGQVYHRCKGEWGYRVPEGAEDQAALRDMCRRAPEFLNDHLSRYRDFLLERLHGADAEGRAFAAERLREIAYP